MRKDCLYHTCCQLKLYTGRFFSVLVWRLNMFLKTINYNSSIKKVEVQSYCSCFDATKLSFSILSLRNESATILRKLHWFDWFMWIVSPLPTCRSSVKRISVNFALLCLSDIMIKIFKESQFTVESGSPGEYLLSLNFWAAAITSGWLRQSRNKTLMENRSLHFLLCWSANSTQTRLYKIIAWMLYIYNISMVSIDLRYFLCGITKS